MQIGPTGATTGPVTFHANDLSRVNDGGTSLLIRATDDSVSGIGTKTLTAEGGTGRIRGEVAGKSNGTVKGTGETDEETELGKDPNTTTNVSAILVGDDHGNGFFIQSTVKTGADTKDTELIVSHGSTQADPAGTSSGIVATGRDGKTEITATSTGKGKSNQTTTRVLTSAAPGKRTHFTVTRTDTGEGTNNSTGTVTIEDGQTERTGNFDGNSVATAVAVYSHRGSYGEDSLSGLPAFQDSGSGTLTTKVNTSYTGDSQSTNYDTTFTLHVGATQNSTEDSIYTLGWTQQGVDTGGHDFYTGETATETVNSRGNTSGSTDVVDGFITNVELTGGSSGSTEQNTFQKWDYRAKDDFFSRLDDATQSTVTTRSGADAEGNPSLSQSIVNLREHNYFEQLTDIGEDEDGWWSNVKTVVKQEKERDAQLATSSGPEGERRQTLAIDHYFWSLDETQERDTWYISGVYEYDPYEYWTFNDVTGRSRRERENSSQYASSHKLNSAGLAYDGKFSASSQSTDTSTEELVGDLVFWNEAAQSTYWFEEDTTFHDENEKIAETRQRTTETGSYYDVGFWGLFAFRVQSGDYTATETGSRTERDEVESTYVGVLQEEPYTTRADTEIDDYRLEKNWRTTTTGKYGPGGITESREYLETAREWDWDYDKHEWEGAVTPYQEYSSEYVTEWQNHNGTIGGHKRDRFRGEGDPYIYDPVDDLYVAAYDHTIEEDLYGGTPPSGPVGGLSYVVHSPPGEQTGAGLGGEEQQGGFQPGTIDVDLLQQRAREALQIANDYLDAEWKKGEIEWEIKELQEAVERGYEIRDDFLGLFLPPWFIDKDAYRKQIHNLEQQARILGSDLQQFRNRLDQDYGDIEFQGIPYWTPSEEPKYAEGGHGADAIIRQAQYGPLQGSIPLGLQSTGGPGELLAFGFAGILKGVGREVAATTAGNVAKNEGIGFANPVVAATETVAPSSGKTVLGSYPKYLELADDLAAKRFSIPTPIWNKMTAAQRWAANQKFLDRLIARGDEIILSNNGHLAEPTSTFFKEIQYLLGKGFRLSDDGLRMLPPGQ